MNGLLLISKPAGITSHDVVKKVRYGLQQSSVGHAGTLDPFATGLMVLLVGKATKLSDYILTGDKGYLGKIKFGVETDTWDITGNIVTEELDIFVESTEVERACKKLLGNIELPVPSYSAVKINGKALHKRARKGEKIENPWRNMHFYDFKTVSHSKGSLVFSIKCHKGGYIRSWASTLGKVLGCGATLEELSRTYSAPYDLSRALELSQFLEDVKKYSAEKMPNFIPLSLALPDWKGITVMGKDEKLIKNGQVPRSLDRRLIQEQKIANMENIPVGVKVFGAQSDQILSLLQVIPFSGPQIKRNFC
jgi:tRNA pseudouridine55 synthase